MMIILSPVGSYLSGGLKPVNILIEDTDVRAVRGGTGYAKCGGNYAAANRAAAKAERRGFDQVLWLDGVHQKYIEEVGGMNVMFKMAGKIVTPALTGSVLPGITRRSCIQLLKDKGYEVEERLISVDEVMPPWRAVRWRRPGAAVPRRSFLHGSLAYRDKQHTSEQPGDRSLCPGSLRYPHRHPVGPPSGSLRLGGEGAPEGMIHSGN